MVNYKSNIIMNHVKKPDWLKISIGANARYTETKHIVDSHKLHTIVVADDVPIWENAGEKVLPLL